MASGATTGPTGGDSTAKHATFGLVINGDNINTAADTFPVLDPITQNVVHYAPAATEAHALAAVAAAEAAFETWRDTTPIERRNIMLKAVEVLQSRQDELVRSMVEETGAKPSWAAFNIRTGLAFVQEAAGMTTQIKGDLLQSNDRGTLAMVFREPCGVILGIAPWNAPIVRLTPRSVQHPSGVPLSDSSSFSLLDPWHPCFHHAADLRQHGHPQGV